jgi:hypothetical protein
MPRRRLIAGRIPRHQPFRRLAQQQVAVPPNVQQALQRAHQHLRAGEYDASLAIYQRLAEEAYKRGRVRPGLHMVGPVIPYHKLPEICHACFAPVHADEVEWTSPDRAECTYCGRPISVD